MTSVDTAITRGKWLFKYPWRILWILCILYILPLLPRRYQLYENYEKTLQFYFESPWGIVGLWTLLFILIFNTAIYFFFYKKGKRWAFENVDDPDLFLREAIKNHFFMTSKELEPINRR